MILQTESIVEEPGEITRIAVHISMHQPEWNSIGEFLLEAREGCSGYAVHELGEHDLLLAFDTRRTQPRNLSTRLQELQSMTTPLIYTLTQMIQDPIAGFMGPVSYPVSAEVHAALLEQQLIVIRLVDLSLLQGDFAAAGTPISMQPVECDEGYELAVVVAGLELFRFAPRMVEQLLANPVALSLSLESLIAVVNQVLSQAEEGGDEMLNKADRAHSAGENEPVCSGVRACDLH
ncbi:hypothetical protein LFT45_19900 [Arthrobacter sp. FW305-BF8]|uniref:hypothetical protein n=1 Tax=Arthrobacter sp. FW305-BF8 TaxID=2879617 RepID=UPI001F30DD79|nr:hypothetical protein [Arthrobacter sp. FW305-BF8]UKA53943.1 hypothetical protein LFT45_19900 [Arthrobacter sp. FW305-BF8]